MVNARVLKIIAPTAIPTANLFPDTLTTSLSSIWLFGFQRDVMVTSSDLGMEVEGPHPTRLGDLGPFLTSVREKRLRLLQPEVGAGRRAILRDHGNEVAAASCQLWGRPVLDELAIAVSEAGAACSGQR